jgi:hypothetical protein
VSLPRESINKVMYAGLVRRYGAGDFRTLLTAWREEQGAWNVAGAWGRDARAYWLALDVDP